MSKPCGSKEQIWNFAIFKTMYKKMANVFDIYILETIHFILGSHTLIDIFDDKCTDDVTVSD